jgi:hypothetical protein
LRVLTMLPPQRTTDSRYCCGCSCTCAICTFPGAACGWPPVPYWRSRRARRPRRN